MKTANIGPYLEKLEQATGEDFSVLKQVIRSSLIYQEGNDHLQTRRVLAQFFSEKSIQEWSTVIDAEIEAHVDKLAAMESPDLVHDFSDPLFSAIVEKMVGLRMDPEVDLIDLVARTRVLTEPLLPLRQIRSMSSALADIMALIPTDGFDGHASPRPLAQVIAEDLPNIPEGVSIIATIAALVVAAHTMAESLAFCLWGLLTREYEYWADAAHPTWRERELERLLGRYPSTLFLYRVADREGEVNGCPYSAGQQLVMHIPVINDTIRAEGLEAAGGDKTCPVKSGQILSFGTGPHKCPGEALARLVIGRAVPALARRFPRLVLHREKIRFLRTDVIQTPSELPCDLWSRLERSGSKVWHVKDANTARKIITDDEAFGPPKMIEHLSALANAGQIDLEVANRMARNAMFFMSGPRHELARRLVSQSLGGNRLATWTPRIDAEIEAALDGLSGLKRPDLISDFTVPVCTAVNKAVLGLYPSDNARFDVLAPEFHKLLEPMLPVREILDLQKTMDEALVLVRSGTAVSNTTGAVGLLQAMQAAKDDQFDDEDCRALALILYGAGFNMMHTLGSIFHWILTLPAEERADVQDPSWVNAKMETLISLLGAPKFIYRMARKAVEIDGIEFKTRDTAQIHLAQVNRGVSNGHLSFGHGLHHCVGAALTRLTIRRAIPALFSRYPDIKLEPQGHSYFEYSQTVALKSLKCISLSR